MNINHDNMETDRMTALCAVYCRVLMTALCAVYCRVLMTALCAVYCRVLMPALVSGHTKQIEEIRNH